MSLTFKLEIIIGYNSVKFNLEVFDHFNRFYLIPFSMSYIDFENI